MATHYRLNRPALLILTLTAILLGRPLQAEPLLLVANDWCPYNCGAQDANKGYLVDLLGQIFADVGEKIEYREVPWSRAIKMVQENKANGLLAVTQQGARGLLLSPPVGVDSSCFYVAKNSTLQVPNMAQLRQLRLGVIQDFVSYDGGGELDKYIASKPAGERVITASGTQALESNFKKIIAGRVDLVIENCNVGDYSLQRFGLTEQIRNTGNLPYYHPSLHIGFYSQDPRAPVWAELIGKAISEKRRNGELAKILHKYGLSDWAGKL
jgi:polar amino acid transport system substrate-binding protein